MVEGVAKLHSDPNLAIFSLVRFFAKCLWPIGYVTLQKIELTKKSLNLDPNGVLQFPRLIIFPVRAQHFKIFSYYELGSCVTIIP